MEFQIPVHYASGPHFSLDAFIVLSMINTNKMLRRLELVSAFIDSGSKGLCRYGYCPNYDGTLVPLAPCRATGRNHFRKIIILTSDLRISENRFMDIKKSD